MAKVDLTFQELNTLVEACSKRYGHTGLVGKFKAVLEEAKEEYDVRNADAIVTNLEAEISARRQRIEALKVEIDSCSEKLASARAEAARCRSVRAARFDPAPGL